MVAELFLQHSLASNFDGNLPDEFVAYIGGLEYGPYVMPGLSGLHSSWYSMVVSPGECRQHDS